MNKREKLLVDNLYAIFGEYENGMCDFPDEYPQMSAVDCIQYAKGQLYDMISDGAGTIYYGNGIAKQLKFLGNVVIHRYILQVADECEVLKN